MKVFLSDMPKEFQDFARWLVPDLLDFCMSWEAEKTICSGSYSNEEFFFSPRFNGVDVKNTPLIGEGLNSFVMGGLTYQKLAILMDTMELLLQKEEKEKA